MDIFAAKCVFLEAISLKEMGRENEAFARFGSLTNPSDVNRVEPWLRGLALVGMAELGGRKGEFQAAFAFLSRAWLALKESGVPSFIAHFHGIKGEIQRDQGLLVEAIDSYRAAVACYLAAGMAALAAYVRIVLGETLLAAGRETEAAIEIVAALPVIEELGLVREGLAATSLLLESVRRQKADPEAVKALRLQVQRMREANLS
jgi:tetratricopeptide (TPR) repeat protein